MVPPLVVLLKENEATAEYVKETNLIKAQLLGHEKIPVHQGAGRNPFVMGEPLMWPELIDTLPTRMHEFYKWYLKASTEGYIMIAARIKHTHFYQGMDDIWIDFDHFFVSIPSRRPRQVPRQCMIYVSVSCQLYTLTLLSHLDFSFPPFIYNRAE